MSEQIERKAVQVGIDFRPIPMDMGDGIEWMFDADPDASLFNDLQDTVNSLKGVEKDPENLPDLKKANDRMVEAFLPMLVEEDQREKFRDTNYGIFALQRLVTVYVEQISGFPTKPQPTSGKRR